MAIQLFTKTVVALSYYVLPSSFPVSSLQAACLHLTFAVCDGSYISMRVQA